MQALARDPRHLYPDTASGRAALLDDVRRRIAALEAHLPRVFADLPAARIQVEPVPQAIEAGAPGGYYTPPAPDGTRPGVYFINLRDTAAWPKWALPTLTHHEAMPGHHLQISLAQEATHLPYLRAKLLWFGAYGEGWALYAEQLADEMGLYADDPLGRLGFAQSMAFRAARCVVDTGLHARRWSRAQAVDYLVSVTGDNYEAMETEVARYAVWPGQATCYMVGMVALLEQRARAVRALGSAFDIKAFHTQVLREGAMPLDVLDTHLSVWIETARPQPALVAQGPAPLPGLPHAGAPTPPPGPAGDPLGDHARRR
jgi:uncharacterized protein (DUF885 family)